jgi:UDP-N-acetylglucosamine diphosphorylase/glucosamine-1-phosphate N-acetyltransferase
MQAVILAAGDSTRTRPLTVTKPKPLLPVANKPLLGHLLDMLSSKSIKDIAVIIGHHKEKIEQYVREKYSHLNITLIEQTERKGTAHAVGMADKYTKEDFIAINGDVVFDELVLDMLFKKYNETKDSVIAAKEVSEPRRFGVFELQGDRILRIHEKSENPPTNLANAGIYLFKHEIFDAIKRTQLSKRGEFELTDSIQLMINEGKNVRFVDYTGYWQDITYAWSLLEVNEHLLSKINSQIIKATVEQNVMIKGPVVIEEGTVLKSGTYIEGPVMIGKNCSIGPNCYIRPYTSIGNNCHVGQACEIKDTIVMDNTHVAHINYVGDSVLSEHVNFSAGTLVANLRHDNGNIKSTVKGELIDTGRRKLGTIIGEGVKTGIGTKIYPGRKIWPNKTTAPGEIVKKDIE